MATKCTLLAVALVLAAFASPRSAAAQHAGVVLGPLSPPPSEVEAGEILLGELNCVACHRASDAVKARLASRQAPILGADGLAITPQYLRAFLASPHSEKPGTTMPDLLHGVDSSRKPETVEALVHFLISQSQRSTEAPMGADAFKIQQGRVLYHQVGCVACHAPQEPASVLHAKSADDGGAAPRPDSAEMETLQRSAIPLGHLAKKTKVDPLARFLMDPLKTRPSGRMPSLNLVEGEATAIAMYLLRGQVESPQAARQPKQIQGLNYQYFHANFDHAPNFDALKIDASGVLDRFTIKPAKRPFNFGFRFTGFVTVPADGAYRFFTHSDDGSRLYVGEKLVVQNDGMHGPEERSGAVQLTAGDHPILVTYFNGGGGGELKVSYQGPGLPKQEIPASVLSHLGQPMIPLDEAEFAVDGAKASRGQELFASLGCAACHSIGNANLSATLSAKPWKDLNPQQADGCLGRVVKRGAPQYHLSEAQRGAMQRTLAQRETLSQSLEAKEQIARSMAALNCFACHSRDGVGGPSPERAHYFTVLGEADLGDEGRIPPHLTRVGDKLKAEWLREVLLNQGAVRPYMATRMPQFGRANVEVLGATFEKADAAGPSDFVAAHSVRDAKFGRQLVGREGLTCIACHTFAQHKSLGIPAMDLTQMTKRLKKSWFRWYLLDPASLRPGTRMPSFWPEGQAANRDILEGDTERQIEAIWAFLSNGRDADVPFGLVQARMELVAEKEPLMYRNFIEGAGARAIAVGYPEKANLAFDAEEVRWAMIWQGAFIDASRHRSDRGAGFTPPLGNNVLKLPPGPPFAILADPEGPWPEAAGKKAGYRMRGYRLDDKRRPTFLYSFGATQIEDHAAPMPGELDPALIRALTLRAEQPANGLWFRAAVGSKIEEMDAASYQVDGKVTIKLRWSGQAKPILRTTGERKELLVPVVFDGKEARIVVEIIW